MERTDHIDTTPRRGDGPRVALLVAAAVLTGGLAAAVLPWSAGAQSTDPLRGPAPTDAYEICLRSGPTTADRLEARAAECRLRVEADAVATCLRNAPRTADAAERWARGCQERAAER